MTPELKQKITEITDPNKGLAEGWCTTDKALAMAGLILAMRPQIVVEMGVFGGRSLLPMALALQHNGSGVVYGVDPWRHEDCKEGQNDPKNDEWWQAQDLEGIYRHCAGLVKRFGVEDHCRLLRMTSDEAARHIAGQVCLCHSDSNHSELVSCREIETWVPRLKVGGLWIADDMNWPSLQKAKGMLQERLEWIGGVEHSWHFMKG